MKSLFKTAVSWLMAATLLFGAAISPAAAQTKNIGQFPSGTTPTGVELVPVWQSSGTYSLTITQIFGAMGANKLSNGVSGSGAIVLATGASIVNANLNTPSAINLANATNLPVAALNGVVSAANGGTGINNGSNTLTLGQALTTTGASAVTLAFPSGGASFTFPGAADTLAGLGTAQTWSAVQTFGSGDLALSGAVTGDIFSVCSGSKLCDSGTLLSSLAPKASPTFTGTVTISGSCTGCDTGYILQVSMSASQTNPGTYTKVPLNNPIVDTESGWDNTNHWYKPTVAGKYSCKGTAEGLSTGTAYYMTLALSKNGLNGSGGTLLNEAVAGQFTAAITTTLTNTATVVADVVMNGTTDTIELDALVSGTGTQSVVGDGYTPKRTGLFCSYVGQ